jgi:hypothetical protein
MATILDCLSQSDCNAVSKSIITDVPITVDFKNLLISPDSFCQLKNCITEECIGDISGTIESLQIYNYSLIVSDFEYKNEILSEISSQFNENMRRCNLANTTLCNEINANYECITSLSINGELTTAQDSCEPSEELKVCLGIKCLNCSNAEYNLTLDLSQITPSGISGNIEVTLSYQTCVDGTLGENTSTKSFGTPLFNESIALAPLSILLQSDINIKYTYTYNSAQIVNTTFLQNQCVNLELIILS